MVMFYLNTTLTISVEYLEKSKKLDPLTMLYHIKTDNPHQIKIFIIICILFWAKLPKLNLCRCPKMFFWDYFKNGKKP